MPAPPPLPRVLLLRRTTLEINEPSRGFRIARDAIVWLSLALLLVGCSPSGTAVPASSVVAEFATPPFYRIDGGRGGTVLLMGTVHLGPPEGWKFSPPLLEGLDRADRFVLEIDLRTATEERVSTLLANTAVPSPPQTLMDLVSPETARLLDENDARLAEMGMPRNARAWKKPWYIALWLIESATTNSGFTAGASAESVILEALGSRPLNGLETLEEQLGIFNNLSPELQDVMLHDTLLRLDSAVEETRSLVHAWQRGDERLLEELAWDGIDELPGRAEFYAAMLTDRNQRWLSQFRSLLDDPEYAEEIIFVGVGALHLVGEDGLVRLLREAGYSALPINQVDHVHHGEGSGNERSP